MHLARGLVRNEDAGGFSLSHPDFDKNPAGRSTLTSRYSDLTSSNPRMKTAGIGGHF